jgi:hypothetical protein
MVDEDWWMGQNSQGETGLFPSNYVELVEDEAKGQAAQADDGPAPPPLPTHPSEAEDAPPAGPPQPAGASGPTATALYDYEAAEDNEISFPEGATITNVVRSISYMVIETRLTFSQEFPDDDWWLGVYNGQSGLFPANYVQLDE